MRTNLVFFRLLTLGVIGSVGSMAGPQQTMAALLGPTPYLAFDNTLPGAGTAISPFSGLGFSFFHLETFEDHLLNTPGVTASPLPPTAGVTSIVFGPSIHDSVDADDGSIDGSGLLGDSFFRSAGASGITFTFNAGVLGVLPTHAGIVWTDGGGTVTFNAFGPGGVPLGTIGPVGGFPDGSNSGTTAEDRFFGVVDAGGISSIFISNSSGGIEVDHLQYGRIEPSSTAIPEPSTLTLLGLGLAGMFGYGWRRKRGLESALNPAQ